MKPTDRQQKLLAKLDENKSLSVEELSEMFGISKETARRDLTALADRNLVRKIHGGAVSVPVGFEPRFPERTGVRRDEKTRAGLKALALVAPGQTLFVDSGTTTLLFAQLLKEIDNLTILTNSLHIVNALCSKHKVFLLGGWADIDAAAVAGPAAIQQAGRFFTDHAFLSIGGLTLENGIFDFTEMDAGLAQVMIKNAVKTTVITDSSKFHKQGLVRVCGWEDIDYLAIDGEAPEDFKRVLAESGVEVL